MNDFLSACDYSIKNRGKDKIGNPISIEQRVRGIVKLLKTGEFDKPTGRQTSNKKETDAERNLRWKNEAIQNGVS